MLGSVAHADQSVPSGPPEPQAAAPGTPALAPGVSPARTGAPYVAGRALVLGLTEYGLAQGGLREGNPLMLRRGVRFGYQGAMVAGFTWYDLRLQRQGRSTKHVRAAFWIVTGINAVLDARTVLRQRRSGKP